MNSHGENHVNEEITEFGLNKTELVRLVIQSLHDIGFPEAARCLEKESGTTALPSHIKELRQYILEGQWDKAERVIRDNSLFNSKKAALEASFYVHRQKFLELLEAGDTQAALECLRNEVTPSSTDSHALHQLTMLMMYSDPRRIRERANWAGRDSRADVLRSLEKCIPPALLLPEHRLQTLLKTAMDYQRAAAYYPYTRQATQSLLEDLEFVSGKLPQRALATLSHHNDEVWYVQFSRSGRYLASASKDKTALIYDIDKIKNNPGANCLHMRLTGHTDALSFLSWSPCEKNLLTCGNDKSVKLWDVETGICVRSFERHTETISACAWFPSGTHFATSSLDKTIQIWDAAKGEVVHSYELGFRVNDLCVSLDGQLLVAIDSERKIRVFDNTSRKEILTIQEIESITSQCISSDNSSVAVNISSTALPEIRSYDLRTGKLIQRYRGHKQARFVIRSCYGGYQQMLLVSGSEDSNVYMWHRDSGKLLLCLEGHTGTVNSVAWNPADHAMFASASDDHSVRIWVPATP